jgi:methylglyoxal synthase
MPPKGAIALVAHDDKKQALVAFVRDHAAVFQPFRLYATGTTGAHVANACPELNLTRVKSGPLGGDQQIGALIADGTVWALFFFIDPLSPMPHDVDVKALTRLAVHYDIPMALNRRTAEILIADPAALEAPAP